MVIPIGAARDDARTAASDAAPTPAYQPLRQLSAGPEGSARLALGHTTHGHETLVELVTVTLAKDDPERWRALANDLDVYALLDDLRWPRLRGRDSIGDVPMLAFEGFAARTLTARLQEGAFDVESACTIVRGLAQGLIVLHRLGLTHGHVSPSRVRLTEEGTPRFDFPWLDVGAPFTALDAACTPPEAALESLDASSDVYALGALLRILLLGREPREDDHFGMLHDAIGAMTRREREARPSMSEVQLLLTANAPTQELPPLTNAPSAVIGGRLGRFELISLLGEGGMGQVFRAVDRATGVHAALKVLRPEANADPNKLKRFRKEARVLREVDSPYVARLIEANRDGGIEFLALELIEGRDLADVLDQRGGRLPEDEALALIGDVCRGLSEAHARGIVHRDIKPENVMIAESPDGAAQHVKLCDFGIARALFTHDGTLGFTIENATVGTPEFMAPEQCNGALISPATDVYALGCTLFLLIAGRAPFAAKDPLALLSQHVIKEPPKLASLAPEVSEATAKLVARMLEKQPVDRPADAAAVLDAIERIRRGDPTSVAVHPAKPSADPKRVVQHVFEWELTASPEALWPYVSNTDRLNRAVGLPPAVFEHVASGERGSGPAQEIVTLGANRVAGQDLRWREHPFEWVEGRRWGVLRVFERGVMKWFTIELELFGKPEGGTRLRYTMTLEPRHAFGRMLVAAEMSLRQKPALGRALARIDGYAKGATNTKIGEDPFEPAPALTAANVDALERALSKLEADGVPDSLLAALSSFCENASAQEIVRLRPLAFANAHRLDPDRTVEACLRGAYHGLFTLLWEVICPLCRVPAGFAESLRSLEAHGHCPACNADFELDFAQSLELVFRVAPDVRASELRTFCVGGPAFAPHVAAQVRLAAGERLDLELSLAQGAYVLRSPQLVQSFPLRVTTGSPSHRATARFGLPLTAAEPRLLLGPGRQTLALENLLEREIVVRLERSAERGDALTAARAACLGSFRKLFPGEVLETGRLVSVGRTAFLVVDVRGQRELMSELGDARAFERVLAQLAELEELVGHESGAIVKTAHGATLCAFDSANAALRTGLSLLARQRAAESDRKRLDVRICAHAGPAVAATFDGRLDYFGQAVEVAFDLVARAPAGRVLFSTALGDDPSVLAELDRVGLTTELADLGALGFGLLTT